MTTMKVRLQRLLLLIRLNHATPRTTGSSPSLLIVAVLSFVMAFHDLHERLLTMMSPKMTILM